VRDYERSLEWCHRLRAFSTRRRIRAFLTACRVKFTGALLWRGEWSACEAELEHAIEELSGPPRPVLRDARARLAELRWRQGRHADARRLLEQAGDGPAPEALRATIALAEGDAAAAVDLVEATLRRTPESARGIRVPALEVGIRACLAAGDVDRAAACAAELEATAAAVETKALRAAALGAAGRVAAARGEAERARELLEDAAYLAEASGSPYEGARLRIALARALATLGRQAGAHAEASRARATFERLGAAADAARARELLSRLTDGSEAPGAVAGRRRAGSGPLTRRQREVLELVARGLSDREIAERLFLSEHTVHRHVANVLGRLRVTSRAAAVAEAVRTDLI
jgi:ATP/maltotriose-dependent transcriptional regulator MalT